MQLPDNENFRSFRSPILTNTQTKNLEFQQIIFDMVNWVRGVGKNLLSIQYSCSKTWQKDTKIMQKIQRQTKSWLHCRLSIFNSQYLLQGNQIRFTSLLLIYLKIEIAWKWPLCFISLLERGEGLWNSNSTLAIWRLA